MLPPKQEVAFSRASVDTLEMGCVIITETILLGLGIAQAG
jgi:hypothetical protein